jgi:YggT family protein
MQSLLAALCEPVLRPFRRILPPNAGLDFSPLWACIAIQALLYFVPVL